MRAIISNGKGSPEVVLRPIPVPKQDEVLMRVHAVGLNRADLLQAEGKYPPPQGATDILGLEASGELESGERVTALLTGGGFGEYVAVPRSAILTLPSSVTETLSGVEMAALPEGFLAAYHILFQKGNLRQGESVLINAAASGVGTSAIQLARTIPNVTVIASARTTEKLEFCRNIGANHTINYMEQDIYEAVMHATNGLRVDLVLDCVGAKQFKPLERSLKTDGRWVMYGLLSGAKSPDIGLAGIVAKRLSVFGTTLRNRSQSYRGELVSSFSQRFGDSFESGGKLRVIVDQVFSGLESTERAFNYMRENRTKGKVVVKL